MQLNFKKVHLHGFLSFGDAELDLNDNGFVLVQGINENPNDNTTSNGSGKSSIWESISWCLTGSTIRGTKDVVNMHTDDGCYVELWFDCDGKNYHLIRSKDSEIYKTNLKIYIDDVDVSGKGIRDSQALLEQYLPDLNAQLLGSVIILGQGLPQRFSNNTPSGRKEILEKLSKSDFMIEDLKNRISERKTILNDKLRSVEDTIVANSSKKSTNEELLLSYKDKLANIGDTSTFDTIIEVNTNNLRTLNEHKVESESESTKLSNTLSDKNQDFTKLNSAQSEEITSIDTKYSSKINEYNLKITEITSKINALKSVYPTITENLANSSASIDELQQTLKDLECSKNEKSEELYQIEVNGKSLSAEQEKQILILQGKYQSELSDIEIQISTTNSQIAVLEKSITEKKNIRDICPTCGQKLPNVIKPDTSEEELKVNNLKSVIDSKIDSKTSISKQFEVDKSNIIAEYEHKKQQLREDYIATKTLIEKISQQIIDVASNIYCKYTQELLPYQQNLQVTISAVQSEKSAINQKYTQLLQDLQFEINSLRQKLDSENKQHSAIISEISNCQKNIEVAESEKKQFADKKSELENQIHSLTETIKQISEKILYNTNEKENISKHIDVVSKFNTVVTRDFRGYLLNNIIEYINLRAKEYSFEVFGTDKIDFVLDGNDIDISYDGKSMDSLSGGERQKVDLIVQFAIRDMLCKFLGFSSSILVLDEIFDQLDFTGCQKMIDLVSHKLSDINSVYIISHHQDLQIPSDAELTIIKNINGISEIKK